MIQVKYARALFLMVISAFLLLGCSSESEDSNSSEEAASDTSSDNIGGELQVAFYAQPPVIDTHRTLAQTAADIAGNIFETLITTDSNKEIQPMLADSWEQSEDGKTITFHLREGVLFHNGEELVAEDVVASMNRWIEISGVGQDQFPGASFEKVDDYTVNLVLSKPNSTSLTILAYGAGNFPAIMPKEVIEGADEVSVQEYIGTGPFEFVEWRQDQFIHLTRFEEYQSRSEEPDAAAGAKDAKVDDIYLHFVTDPSTRTAGLLSGEYDISVDIPTDGVTPLENDDNVEIITRQDGNLEFYFNKRKGLFTDPNARMAVALALNPEEIMQSAFDSEEYYVLNHNMMLKNQEEQWDSDHGKDIYYESNIEKAKELLAKTDYNGEELTILSKRNTDYMYNSTVVLQQQLEQIGLKAKLDVIDRATYETLRADEDAFDIFPVSNVPRPEPTSSVFLRKDFGGWTESDEMDEIVAEFRGQRSLEDTIPLYDDLQKWFWEYLPIIKVGEMKKIDAVQTYVDGYEFHDAMILWNVELAE